jgi:hypothetical protein
LLRETADREVEMHSQKNKSDTMGSFVLGVVAACANDGYLGTKVGSTWVLILVGNPCLELKADLEF